MKMKIFVNEITSFKQLLLYRSNKNKIAKVYFGQIGFKYSTKNKNNYLTKIYTYYNFSRNYKFSDLQKSNKNSLKDIEKSKSSDIDYHERTKRLTSLDKYKEPKILPQDFNVHYIAFPHFIPTAICSISLSLLFIFTGFSPDATILNFSSEEVLNLKSNLFRGVLYSNLYLNAFYSGVKLIDSYNLTHTNNRLIKDKDKDKLKSKLIDEESENTMLDSVVTCLPFTLSLGLTTLLFIINGFHPIIFTGIIFSNFCNVFYKGDHYSESSLNSVCKKYLLASTFLIICLFILEKYHYKINKTSILMYETNEISLPELKTIDYIVESDKIIMEQENEFYMKYYNDITSDIVNKIYSDYIK
jgi:hypothetical protein